MPESSRGSRLRASLPRRFRSAFTEHLPIKATAIFLAIVLWTIVEGEEMAIEEVGVSLQLQLDSNLVLISPRPSIRAQVSGSVRELNKLFSRRPEIIRAFDGAVADSVHVDLSVNDVQLPPGVDAVVRAVEPRSFILHFDSLLQRRLPVRSALRIRGGSGVTLPFEPAFDPESVTVTGQRQIVQQLESISTVGRTIAARDTLPFEINLDTLRLGVRVVPGRVRATIPVPPATIGPP